MMRRIKRGRTGGFSLLELMIAVIVLMIAAAAALATQITTMNMYRVSKDTTTAMSDLQAAMEQVLSLPLDQIPLQYPPGTSIAQFDDRNLDGERITPVYPAWDGISAIPDPLEIQLVMTWNPWNGNAGSQRTLRLASMKTR